jgi:ribA/ribD-fused uncharacterized protein
VLVLVFFYGNIKEEYKNSFNLMNLRFGSLRFFIYLCLMERITDTHIFFWNGELSNWYPCKFVDLGITFHNSEQAFMCRKAAYFEDWETYREILTLGHNPTIAKKLGRKVKNFTSLYWSEVCLEEMIDVNMAKFSQDPYFKDLLINTGNKTIVEASPVDLIWGIGLHWENDDVLDESKWRGQNLLGKALMEVRKRLNEEKI